MIDEEEEEEQAEVEAGSGVEAETSQQKRPGSRICAAAEPEMNQHTPQKETITIEPGNKNNKITDLRMKMMKERKKQMHRESDYKKRSKYRAEQVTLPENMMRRTRQGMQMRQTEQTGKKW